MKVLVSRRPFSYRLNIYLIFYCSLILLGLWTCDARRVAPDNSASRIDEVYEESVEAPLTNLHPINQEIRDVDEDEVVKERILQQLTKIIGKSNKENKDRRFKDLLDSRDAEHDRKIQGNELVVNQWKDSLDKRIYNYEKENFKRLIKRSITRLKRDDKSVVKEQLEVSNINKSISNEKSKIDNAEKYKRIDVEGLEPGMVTIKDNQSLSQVNSTSSTSQKTEADISEFKSSINNEMQSLNVKSIVNQKLQNSENPELISFKPVDEVNKEATVIEIPNSDQNIPETVGQTPLFGFYSNPIDPDALIFDILIEGLLKNPPNENSLSFIDTIDKALSKSLPSNRLQLLKMTEKFIPENLRQNYSGEILSCVKRMEYFNCLKYVSWPKIKQYYSDLPEFPLDDFYLVSLIYPNYPMNAQSNIQNNLDHPSQFVGLDMDRMKPETVIVDMFKNILAQQFRIATPPTPVHSALIDKCKSITHEQITSIHLAEQLLPLNLRSTYISKAVDCIIQFDYCNCMKFFTWPLIQQFNPALPEFPDFQLIQIKPNLMFTDYSNLLSAQQQTTTSKSAYDSSSENTQKSSTLESRIYEILKTVRDNLGATPLSSASYTNKKIFLYPLMTTEQTKIFSLAESIVPPLARESLITSVYFCLKDKNEFLTCTKTIIWPFIRSYVKGVPEFPIENHDFQIQQNFPLISSSKIPINSYGDNFIMREIEKFFSEGNENAMSYIVRSIQLSSTDSLNTQKLLQILRSIQFNAPSFLSMQSIQYTRIPEFSSILTENQENIVHAVESIIPEQSRSKFKDDMINCTKRKKFSTCSRNVIFPFIHQQLQKVLFVPYNNTQSEQKSSSKININISLNIKLSPNVTKSSNEELNDDTVVITARKLMPIYPSNPELVIFNLLQKVQKCSDVPLVFTNESATDKLEFRKIFSLRQRHILNLAELMLPEECRKKLLEKMYKCIGTESFLNCTRDILFPVMSEVYPKFPDFPDFEKELNRSNAQLVINNLNNTETTKLSTKKTLPSIEILYKFIPEDKSNLLRTLVDKLPDSLYYDLYVKMTQCTQYSEAISCSHDIVYPTLKQYYDVSGFNLDNYYPVSAEPPFLSTKPQQLIDYQLLCENMGFICALIPFESQSSERFSNANISESSSKSTYVPFGKLSDGSRIFKQTEDIWDSNITPLVGTEQISLTGFENDARKHIDQAEDSQHEHKQSTSTQHLKNPINKFLKRKRRNVEENPDTYSDPIPDNNVKNYFGRRNIPKLTLTNMTETELLQLLIHISKSKDEKKSGHENVSLKKKYFVDTLNDTDKALLTADQYEILKLVQDLSPDTARAGFMSRLIQCIRSLSFLRCIAIFAWPVIVSNLPSLPFTRRDSRAVDLMKIPEVFGVPSSEFQVELIKRKEHIESNLVQWYKSLTEDKFETNLGPLKLKGYGDGELAISLSGFREGRLSKFKDNKNVPSILTIISDMIEEVFDTKGNRAKNKKDKRNRSSRGFEDLDIMKYLRNNYEKANSKRSVKDDQVINMLLERLRPNAGDVENEDVKHYYNVENAAYKAFQVLFGPKATGRIPDQLKSIDNENLRNFDDTFHGSKHADDLKVSVQKSRAMLYDFVNINSRSNAAPKLNEKIYSNKRKIPTELAIRLPKLNDEIAGYRKITNSLNNMSKGMKHNMMPLAGVAISFVVQLALSHAKAAASVAGLLSNMALGSAMLGMVRDMIFKGNNQPVVKYIYDTEKYDSDITWPDSGTHATYNYPQPNEAYAPSPHFQEPY